MKSIFNWHSEKLSLQTIITNSYKNTQNVRRFFKQHIGEHFSFDRKFMAYLKNSTGITLADAIKEWHKTH